MSLEIIIIAAVVIGVIVLSVIGVPLTLNFSGFHLKTNKRDLLHKSRDIRDIARHYTTEIEKARCNILRNQMIYAENILEDINNHIDAEISLNKCQRSHIYMTVKNIIKVHMLGNGFDTYDSVQFSKYVGSRIDLLRNKYKELVECEYIYSHSFTEKICDIYHHALACDNYWKDKMRILQEEMEYKIDEIVGDRNG